MLNLKSTALAAALAVSAPLATVALASTQTIDAPSGTYAADPTHTNVLWSVSHFGLSNYIGRFNDIQATLELNAEDPTQSQLTVTIDPKSVDTNYPPDQSLFDSEIAGEKFFNADQYPEITFVSKEIAITGENSGTVTGDLTFHGVTKPVTLEVTLNAALNPHPMSNKPTLGFSASTVIKRSEFGVDALVGPVGDEVTLIIETEFVQQ